MTTFNPPIQMWTVNKKLPFHMKLTNDILLAPSKKLMSITIFNRINAKNRETIVYVRVYSSNFCTVYKDTSIVKNCIGKYIFINKYKQYCEQFAFTKMVRSVCIKTML